MSTLEFPAKSPEDLDLEIGRLLLADQLGSKDMSDDETRAAARNWLTAKLGDIRAAVCVNPVVREHLTGKAKPRNELFGAVLDALSTWSGHGGIPLFTLAARLIHYSVEELCPECASPGPK